MPTTYEELQVFVQAFVKVARRKENAFWQERQPVSPKYWEEFQKSRY